MEHKRERKWEIEHSSLFKIANRKVTIEECREYAKKDIISNLTRIPLEEEKNGIVEINPDVDFHLIGRVDTDSNYNPKMYYHTMKKRTFVSFSIINKNNISHYLGDIFFLYNIKEEDIVHIFPVDSATKTSATEVEELTVYPSLWINLNELEKLTNDFGVYNQITCRTKRNNNIIKPVGVAAFKVKGEIKAIRKIEKVAREFKAPIIVLTPKENAIAYADDLLADKTKCSKVSDYMKVLYGFEY